jgi:subtilisin-like proprotein convertase family protein
MRSRILAPTALVLGLLSSALTAASPTYVSQALKVAVSAPVSALPPALAAPGALPFEEIELNRLNTAGFRPQLFPNRADAVDGALDTRIWAPNIPGPLTSFDGVASADNAVAFGGRVSPPDTDGDVGPNHYVAQINLLARIYDKAGNPLTGPFKVSSLFAPLGSECSASDDRGDPIVLYDQLADRWLLSQFGFSATNLPPYHMCIAISTTPDPTGTYFVYDFQVGGVEFPDYPKLGIWPDGYYLSVRQFTNGGPFNNPGVAAFDRTKMLVGDPTAGQVYFNLSATLGQLQDGILPSDFEGFTPPPAGRPNTFAIMTAGEYGNPQGDALRLFDFHVDWVTPASSTFAERPESPLAVAAFDPIAPGDIAANRRDIPQPPPAGATNSVDSVTRLLHRLVYRNFGGFETLVVNHAVNAGTPLPAGPFRSGIRYYEIRSPLAGAFAVQEQGTHAPADGLHRWMGSAANDWQGNLAVGYSTSNNLAPNFPSVRYAGRLAGDAPGSLAQGEGTLVAGTGVQLSTSNRWGDYSALSLDPVDDCTFWYTQEYYTAASQATSTVGWLTRIGSFRIPAAGTCTPSPRGTLNVNVTNCATGLPIAGAPVNISGGYFRATNGAGLASVAPIAPGGYTVTAGPLLPGYPTASAPSPVTVTDGGTATVNVCLNGVPALDVTTTTVVAETCTPANGVVDPGERVQLSVCVANVGGADTVNLVGTLQASGGVTNPSAPQIYGVVAAGGAPVCRTFQFDAAGSCGGTLTLTLGLQDGATNLGTTAEALRMGVITTTTTTFSNNTAITIPIAGPTPGAPYPSTIAVAGMPTTTTLVRVSLNGLSHTFPDDLDILLAGPTGAGLLLMSDVGTSVDLVGVNFQFSDAAASRMYDSFPLLGTSWKPTDYNPTEVLPAPAPAVFTRPYPIGAGTLASVFDGLDPNGNWSLFVYDAFNGDGGSIANGWSIEITSEAATCSSSCAICDLTCADIAVGTDPGLCSAAPPLTPGQAGTCGSVTCVPAAGTAFPLGLTPVSCSSSQGLGACAMNVTVTDDDAPTVTAPDLTVNTDPGVCTGTASPLPTAADNCPGVVASCTPPGPTFALGVTPVSCTATDGAGLQTIDAGSVTVNDLELPVLVCPADIVEDLPPGDPDGVVSWADPVATDNCPGFGTPACVPPSGSVFDGGVITPVTCTVLDGSNNTGTCAFNVTLGLVSILEIPAVSTRGLLALAALLAAVALLAVRRLH